MRLSTCERVIAALLSHDVAAPRGPEWTNWGVISGVVGNASLA